MKKQSQQTHRPFSPEERINLRRFSHQAEGDESAISQRPFSPEERAKLRRLLYYSIGNEACSTPGPFVPEDRDELYHQARRAIECNRLGLFSQGEREALHFLLEEQQIAEHHQKGLQTIQQLSLTRPTKINLGCGQHPKPGFLNIDSSLGNDLTLDLRKDLPFESDSCDLIFSEHFIEHLGYPQPVTNLFRECLRVLKPGGLLHFSVPDTGWPMADYNKGYTADYFRACRASPDPWHRDHCTTRMEHINHHFRQCGEHRFAYDEETVRKVLEVVGFSDVRRMNFDPSIDSKHREIGSLFVSARKPSYTDRIVADAEDGTIAVAPDLNRPAKDSPEIEVVITCVHYSDFLKITLPVTTRLFQSVTVATSPADADTLTVALQYGARAHVTDVWHRNDSSFNKAAALNECLSEIRERRTDDCWVLLLDADIIFSESILADIRKLDKRGLYSIRRRLCETKRGVGCVSKR